MIHFTRSVLVTLAVLAILQGVGSIGLFRKKPATVESQTANNTSDSTALEEGSNEKAKVETFYNEVLALFKQLLGCLPKILALSIRLALDVNHFDPDALPTAMKLAQEIINALKNVLQLNLMALPCNSSQHKLSTKALRLLDIITDLIEIAKNEPKMQVQRTMQLVNHISKFGLNQPLKPNHTLKPLTAANGNPIQNILNAALNPLFNNNDSNHTFNSTGLQNEFQKNVNSILKGIFTDNLKLPVWDSKAKDDISKPKPTPFPIYKMPTKPSSYSMKVTSIPSLAITQPTSDSTTNDQSLGNDTDVTTNLPIIQDPDTNINLPPTGQKLLNIFLNNKSLTMEGVKPALNVLQDILNPPTPSELYNASKWWRKMIKVSQ